MVRCQRSPNRVAGRDIETERHRSNSLNRWSKILELHNRNGLSRVDGCKAEMRGDELRVEDLLFTEVRRQISPIIESTNRSRVSCFEESLPHSVIVGRGRRELRFEG